MDKKVDPPQTPQEEAKVTDVPPKNPPNQLTMVIIGLVALIPLVYAILNYETFIGMAASVRCKQIQQVAISPGAIVTSVDAPQTELSAMALDANGQAITKAVVYDWGISSDNSIGTVRSRQDLGSFIPQNVGMGDLYVQVKNSCTKQKVIGSIKVQVQ